MHLVYIDEVKFHPNQEPKYWLCGLAIQEDDIISIESELNAIAKNYFGCLSLESSTEFHANQIVQGKGPFKRHNIEDRLSLYKELASVIDSYPNIGRILICIDPAKITKGRHEEYAFMFMVERIEQLMVTRKSKALMIVDHDKEFVNMNVQNLLGYKQDGTDFAFSHEINNIVDTVHHTHSHHSRLIQLADLFTYSMSFIEKDKLSYPKQQLKTHIIKLSNFSFPTKYKFWPN